MTISGRSQRNLLLDTNLLLLLMFKILQRDPAKDTRLAKYSVLDLVIIEKIVSGFEALVTTPNILSEVSNLIRKNSYEEFQWLSSFILKNEERVVISKSVVSDQMFIQLGLTDIGFREDVFHDCYVVTDDQALARYLLSLDKKVINYTDFKTAFRGENS